MGPNFSFGEMHVSAAQLVAEGRVVASAPLIKPNRPKYETGTLVVDVTFACVPPCGGESLPPPLPLAYFSPHSGCRCAAVLYFSV